METPNPVLIYDAECPVCRNTVDWVRRNASAPDAFEFLPCRSAEARDRFPRIEEAACLQAVHLVLPDGRVLAGERAFPEILCRLPRYRRAAALFRLPGAGILSRALYRRFAAHRYALSAMRKHDNMRKHDKR